MLNPNIKAQQKKEPTILSNTYSSGLSDALISLSHDLLIYAETASPKIPPIKSAIVATKPPK